MAVARAAADMVSTPDEAQKLEVIRLGHPILRQVADPVPEEYFGSSRLHDLFRNMARTMGEEEGVGLAAPQVAEALRLFVYRIPGDGEMAAVEPTLLANPEIRAIGSEAEEGWEGCLSIPGLRGLVPRHKRIKVRARSLEGQSVSFTADSFQARVIQHEFDHLEGVVYLDRMTSPSSLAFEKEWERYILRADE
ncbi:MAG: peptide deformylase [Thermoanaerobaculales bacterium]|nr:peptide deformylase [Thermoanaerobaculales bacterium]